jgi:hypothetical protein
MTRPTIILGLCLALGAPAASAALNLDPAPIQSQLATDLQVPLLRNSNGPAATTSLLQARDDWGVRQEDPGRKSASKALLYSALLPGLGEYYVGNRKKARYFFAAEAVWWLGFLSFHTYGQWKEDDYINFARERADARIEDKDGEFRDWVGFYDDIDQFNEFGRVQDRDRPYLVDNESNHWRWRNPADKSAYRELKNRSREAFRRRDFTIGLMILNRIVSIIDAVHDARKTRTLFGNGPTSRPQRFGYKLNINPLNVEQPVHLSLFARF